jgi:hypothetical protein
MRAKQQKLQQDIADLKGSLRVPLKRIRDEEESIATAIEQERKIKARGEVVDGQRRLPEADRSRLTELNREITARQKQIKAIEAEAGRPLRRLRNHQKELLRIKGKDNVYRIDVELDQLMGFFRIGLVNMAAWFLSNCLKSKMSLGRLFNAIFMLPGRIELTDELRRVILTRNPKDPATMEQLEAALQRLTNLAIRDLDDRRIEFQLSSLS